MQTRWYAVILHWGAIDVTVACLRSVDRLRFAKVVLIDNGTNTEGLGELARARANRQLVRRPGNGGYAAGNNEGLRMALAEGAEFFAILNNDVVVEYPTMLADAERAFRDCTRLGAVSPTVLVRPENWIEQEVSSRFQRMLLAQAGDLKANPPAQLPAALRASPAFAGCCWMGAARVLHEVGLLREELFLYREELDYAVRLKRAGYICARLDARGGHVRHWGSKDSERSPSRAYYASRNLVRVLDGFSPAARPRLLAAAAGSVALTAIRCLAIGRLSSATACARGLVDGLRGRRGQMEGNPEQSGGL